MSDRHAERLRLARESLAAHDADVLLVPPSADFTWLTGAHARVSERLLVLGVPRIGEPFAIVPALESDALAHECPWLEREVWADHEDPFPKLAARLDLDRRPRLRIGEGLRVAPLLRLAAATACAPAAPVLGPLRARKDADEIGALERAGRHADAIVEQAADFARPGMTEHEVARFVADRFHEAGDLEPWVIVASGPNAALPHHSTSARVLGDGECLLIDCGAYTDGYGSDITRTYWLGTPPDEAVRAFDVVNAARAAGIAAARPGVPCEDVDRAARDVIERAGLGPHFLHRTGHGVGMEVHEPPYLVGGNRERLEVGNVHSVEPGVYFAGRFGVRLEDLVVVEDGGARRLNRAPLDLRPPRARA